MLIGLHGKARSGKDTSYQFIREWAVREGLSVRREAFADRLKLSAAKAIGYEGTLEECVAICDELKQDGWEVAVIQPDGLQHPISGRQYLQRYGTEAHREIFGLDFWIDVVMKTYEPDDELLVVTDVRFANEAEAIRMAGGLVWHILRPDTDGSADAHASERPLDPDQLDLVLVNNQDLDHLHSLVEMAMEALVYV